MADDDTGDGRPDDDAAGGSDGGETAAGPHDESSVDRDETFVFETAEAPPPHHDEVGTAGADDVGGSDASRSAPLSDLAGRVAERRARAAAGDDADALFEEVDPGDLEAEEVWTSLVEGDSAGPETDVGVGAEARRVSDGDASTEHVVPKAEYCQRCPHFSAPPELGCTHDGTVVVAVPDSEHFRVRNCPMVDDADE